jgi:F-type H+-transporting ATPase subunit b
MRVDMLEQTKQQQAELLERARRDIDAERLRAIADLRREAVDLALAGATKVIGRNLDETANRRLVEDFLATVPPLAGTPASGLR